MEEELFYKREKFTISLDNKEELILIEVHGIHSLKDAEDFKVAISKLYKDIPEDKRKKVLLDFSKIDIMTHEARRFYTTLSKEFSQQPKIAVFGMNIVMNIALEFVVIASGRKGIKFFKEREGAVKWLNKQK